MSVIPARHLYIYYKVYKHLEPEILPQTKFLMGSMRADCIYTALRKRTGEADYDTWMEVYEGTNELFRQRLVARLAQPECALLRQLDRHEEWFEDIPV